MLTLFRSTLTPKILPFLLSRDISAPAFVSESNSAWDRVICPRTIRRTEEWDTLKWDIKNNLNDLEFRHYYCLLYCCLSATPYGLAGPIATCLRVDRDSI